MMRLTHRIFPEDSKNGQNDDIFEGTVMGTPKDPGSVARGAACIYARRANSKEIIAIFAD